MEPLVFEPFFRPQVWGGRRLERLLGKRLPPEGRFGESWEVSAHPLHVSRVAEGPQRGAGLDELWGRFAGDWVGRGPVPPRFPWLVKFLDCDELLSVQVHPDDAAAGRLVPGESGKTEAWLVLHAEPGARIFAGLLPGTTGSQLARHLEAGTVSECLHAFAPRAGDFVFLPAGTVHSAGGGVVLLEIQQTSDATFRLFDWNRPGPDGRPRALHGREAMDSIDWSLGPVSPLRSVGGADCEQLVACEHFCLKRYRVTESLPLAPGGQMSVWAVVGGEAELAGQHGGYRRTFGLGATVLVPGLSEGFSWTVRGAGPATLVGVEMP